MADATPTQGAELVALAEKCGAEVGIHEGQMVWAKFHSQAALEAFAAALRSPGPQAGEPSELPLLPTAAYSLDLHDGHPVVAYSPAQMVNFAREAQRALPDKLATLGWQAIECDLCGSGARAFPVAAVDERTAFEAWRRRTTKMANKDDSVAREGFGDDANYADRTTRSMWLGWKARAALAQAHPPVDADLSGRAP